LIFLSARIFLGTKFEASSGVTLWRLPLLYFSILQFPKSIHFFFLSLFLSSPVRFGGFSLSCPYNSHHDHTHDSVMKRNPEEKEKRKSWFAKFEKWLFCCCLFCVFLCSWNCVFDSTTLGSICVYSWIERENVAN